MIEDKHHSIHPNLDELIRYKKDQLNSLEANRMEKHLLDCPLCVEAMEGMEERDPHLLKGDLSDLQSRITQRTKTSSNYRNYGIAAAIVLLIVSTFLIIENQNQEILSTPSELAMEDSNEEPLANDPNPTPVQEDEQSSSVAEENDIGEEKAIEPSTSNLATGKSEIANPANGSGMEQSKEKNPELDLLVSKSADAEAQPVSPETPGPVAGERSSFESSEISIEEIDLALATRTRSQEASKMKKSSAQPTLELTKSRRILGNIYSYDDLTPLPGVNVVLKGTTNGTITDLNGNFEMVIPHGEQTLIVNYVGYVPLEYKLDNTDSLEIALDTDVTALSEVVFEEKKEDVDDQIRIQPKPGIGRKAYRRYLEENLNYPESARENRIEGKVILNVSFNEFGIIKDIEVRKGLGYGCDEEALRLVREGPLWEPGKIEGEAVDMELIVRIKFNLEE